MKFNGLNSLRNLLDIHYRLCTFIISCVISSFMVRLSQRQRKIKKAPGRQPSGIWISNIRKGAGNTICGTWDPHTIRQRLCAYDLFVPLLYQSGYAKSRQRRVNLTLRPRRSGGIRIGFLFLAKQRAGQLTGPLSYRSWRCGTKREENFYA